MWLDIAIQVPAMTDKTTSVYLIDPLDIWVPMIIALYPTSSRVERYVSFVLNSVQYTGVLLNLIFHMPIPL